MTHLPPSQHQQISEEMVESYLVSCMTGEGDPQVANLLIRWLDKKKAIQPDRTDELNESNHYTQEFREIQNHVLANTNDST